MIRNVTFRRCAIATLFIGLFTQVQTVFACQFKHGKPQFVYYCGKISDNSMGCDMGGTRNDSAVPLFSGVKRCEVSYKPAQCAIVITREPYTQQVLLLDAPEPPPLLTSSDLEKTPALSQVVHYTTDIPPWIASTKPYLLTNRLRI